MDIDSVQSLVWVVKLRVIHWLNGFSHLFNADAFTLLVVLSVLLGFSCFGVQTFPVGCDCASVIDGVCGWLLRRRIVRSAVPRIKGFWVL